MELELIYMYVIGPHWILRGELADDFMLQMVSHVASVSVHHLEGFQWTQWICHQDR